MLSVKLIGHR